MKHPALVRVFAVVLAILSLTMLFAGIMGFENARVDYEDSLDDVDKMLSDIEEYKTLLADNEGKETYDTVSEALSELQEKHEETSAEHKMEIATYSATKGGIQAGVDALDQADAAMADARAQFEAGKAEFEAKKASFMVQYNAYQQGLAALPEMKAGAAQMQAVIDAVDPTVLAAGKQQMEAMALALEEEGAQLKAEEDAVEGEIPEELKNKRLEFDAKKNAFDVQYAGFMEQYNGYQQAVAALPALNEQIAAIEAVDPAQLEAGKAQLDAVEQSLAEGERQLAEGEALLYHNRTLIWYELGQLEEQAAELEVTRTELMQESEEIAQKTQQSEEQKQREKRIRSLYLTFMDKPEVEEAVNSGKDFVATVEDYIARFNAEAHKENVYRGYACILMVVSMLPLFICFLASFEIIKKTGFVRSGALMVLLCSVAALGLLNYAGMGVSYSAASVMIFAVLQILVSGKKKKIKVK